MPTNLADDHGRFNNEHKIISEKLQFVSRDVSATPSTCNTSDEPVLIFFYVQNTSDRPSSQQGRILQNLSTLRQVIAVINLSYSSVYF